MKVLLIITLGLAFLYVILMLTYSYGWRKLSFFTPKYRITPYNTTVSVIIPARDEAGNITPLLDAIHAQSYPSHLFEVIVIDDFSEDETAQLVLSHPAENVKLIKLSDRLSKNERLNSYKKKAIELAIKESTGALIVTTDADCVMGPLWLETIVAFYEDQQPKFIAAPVSFFQEDNFFKTFQSLDFMTMQGITGAMAYLQSGTMCNGANLAYERAAFDEVGGFLGIDMIASGDDMLLMYKIFHAYPKGVLYLKNKDAIVRTLPVDTIKGFMNQRIRWSSKADKYEDKRITQVLALVYFWNVSLLVLFVAALFMPALWLWLGGLMILKILVELYFLSPVAKFFSQSHLLKWFIPGQPFHILYVIVAGWLGKFGSYQWKGRTVK
ncbi:cellulose synthase/poly-beta-1,6-N-acetylglucosamine synthase-like glycosyltransferase [Chitinophaga skermanii]|uniref:Cellulose synthase/poly-beta-1,6-N-acetylglucosamine synthase-like glycosyltransferase n=1 Tax=Chitinophaga skermanii TaxID=331697 RepID=A0A327R3W3_9BACT|nr:glycosyltransferase [Chitinophaga skermanii]RAJ10464.1 cellulose synthase/poly-beta-1,6-N-acetylglucosamine synthase-like glycosyltransferase [Chitinophaga skermanii]